MPRSHPTFIGIGAQKAGTGWLAHVLRQHPDIWIPPSKEIHYFDRSTDYPSPNWFSIASPVDRLLGKGQRRRRARQRTGEGLRRAGSALRAGRTDEAAWLVRWHVGHCNDTWYLNLFRGRPEVATGEISPAYSMLTDDDVMRVAQLLPDLRILLMLRNPIERAWSHIRFNYLDQWKLPIPPMDELIAFIERPGQIRRSDYRTIIRTWQAHFPPEQIFIGFTEQIRDSPLKLFSDLCTFLGVEQRELPDALLCQPVSESSPHAMPLEVRAYLSEKYAPELEALASQLGPPCDQWHEAAVRDLQHRTTPGWHVQT
jgi:hypothetical protein